MHSCSKVPSDWASKSQKKTHRRFWTPFITERLGLLSAAEEKLAAAQKDTLRYSLCPRLLTYIVYVPTTTMLACLSLLMKDASARSFLSPSRSAWLL